MRFGRDTQAIGRAIGSQFAAIRAEFQGARAGRTLLWCAALALAGVAEFLLCGVNPERHVFFAWVVLGLCGLVAAAAFDRPQLGLLLAFPIGIGASTSYFLAVELANDDPWWMVGLIGYWGVLLPCFVVGGVVAWFVKRR